MISFCSKTISDTHSEVSDFILGQKYLLLQNRIEKMFPMQYLYTWKGIYHGEFAQLHAIIWKRIRSKRVSEMMQGLRIFFIQSFDKSIISHNNPYSI